MAFSCRSVASLLLVPSILSSYAVVLPIERRGADFETITPEAFREATTDQVTDNYLTLTKGSADTSRSFKYLRALQKERVSDASSIIKRQDSPSTPLIPAGGGSEYLIDVTIGTQAVKAIVDTGSSDTWLIQKGFRCVDQFGSDQAESACNFGPVYTCSFAPEDKIANVNFNISYGDGEFVTGNMGYADVTVAKTTVKHQEVCIRIQISRQPRANQSRLPLVTMRTGMVIKLRLV
jgi:hypothetical protein